MLNAATVGLSRAAHTASILSMSIWRQRVERPIPAPKPAPAPIPPDRREWYVATYADATHSYVLLVYEPSMRRNGSILIDDCAEFAKVQHTDAQFEEKWGTAIKKAKRRIEVLNAGVNFGEEIKPIEDGSVCGNCGKGFEGEDYLCPECRD